MLGRKVGVAAHLCCGRSVRGRGSPGVAEHRRWFPCFFDRPRDLVWNRVVNHVSNTGYQPEDAVRNFLVKLNGLAVLYNAILRAGHDNDWHR
jgi:hypothetical protein